MTPVAEYFRKPSVHRPMPAALPVVVQRALRGLSQRVLHIRWLEGALWIALAGTVLPLLQMTADMLFDLSLGIRALLMVLDLAVIAALAFHFGLRPWRRRLGPEEAALRAEAKWPELRTSLISAVQLARVPDGSRHLVNALLEQVAKKMAEMDLRAAAGRSHLKRLASIVVASALLLAALTWLTAPKSSALWQRFFLRNVPLPTQTIVVPISGDFTIAPGQSVELSARAQGIIPRTGRLEITYAGRRPEWVAINPKATTRDVFTLALANVQQPLTYRFYLNDGRGAESKITIVHPPVIRGVKFEQEFPGYTGLPRTVLAAGNLNLLAGSRLHITGQADQNLKGAQLVLKGMDKTVSLKIGSDGKSFAGELAIPVKDLSGFSIVLRNDAGVETTENTVYAVEILPDKPPEITIAPGQPAETTIVATANPRIRFATRDDFQVKQVSLCVQLASALAEGEVPDPAKAKKIPIPMPKPAAALAFDFEWKEPGKTLEWREGTTVNYWIEAVENNDVTGPGVSHSGVRQWSVVSVQTKRDELAETLRKHAESIEDLSRTQQELKARVGELLKQDDKK